ncbi:hypothetical protein CHU92_05110, partial [Flavobacterium cyanobacteriorum]
LYLPAAKAGGGEDAASIRAKGRLRAGIQLHPQRTKQQTLTHGFINLYYKGIPSLCGEKAKNFARLIALNKGSAIFFIKSAFINVKNRVVSPIILHFSITF